ncbi:MAG: hypothetical protein Q8838_02640, partial [Candidatus Phytoplasma australasiaticum]|nr:hypothetical protein [Candidatus Phytoplasma australasiaticum]
VKIVLVKKTIEFFSKLLINLRPSKKTTGKELNLEFIKIKFAWAFAAHFPPFSLVILGLNYQINFDVFGIFLYSSWAENIINL